MANLTVTQANDIATVIHYLSGATGTDGEPVRTAGQAGDALARLAEAGFARMMVGPRDADAEAAIDAVEQLRATVQALGPDDGRHIIELRPDGFTIQHPLACRPILFNCPVNRVAQEDLAEPPDEYGRFYCEIRDGWLAILRPRRRASGRGRG